MDKDSDNTCPEFVSPDGQISKQVYCPHGVKPDMLQAGPTDQQLSCPHCPKPVHEVEHYSEEELNALMARDPDACLLMPTSHVRLRHKGPLAPSDTAEQYHHLRKIETARTLDTINAGIAAGFRAILETVVPNPQISHRFCLLRHRVTGQLVKVSDLRAQYRYNQEYEEILPWTRYYPYSFPSPYAAYLLPPEVKPGETVYLNDIIADYALSQPQGHTSRLMAGVAVWDGEKMVVDTKPLMRSLFTVG